MKVGSWNIRGLGCAEKRRAVRRFFTKGKFDAMLIQESKIKEVSQKLLRWLWGNCDVSYEFVLANGNAGGLITCWKNNFFKVENKIVGQRFILVIGVLQGTNFMCGLGNVYAPNDDRERREWFEELSLVLNNTDCPWILGGDFNIIRTEEEKVGVVYNTTAMDNFSSFIESIGCIDLPLSGGKFTWTSNRDSPTFCRLDRFLCSPEVLLQFSNVVQKLWPRSLSDHYPVSLETNTTNWGPKPFRFYNYWLDSNGFKELVVKRWSEIQGEVGSSRNVWFKLRELKIAIKGWAKEQGSIDHATINTIEEDIHKMEIAVQEGSPWENVKAKVMAKRMQLWALHRAEERMWLQKSRVKWLREGDRNTSFFHLAAKIRKDRNSINQLSVNDSVYNRPEDIKRLIFEHFSSFFSKDEAVQVLDLDCAFRKLRPESARDLEKPFSEEEVWEAVRNCDGNKAPGPDGFNFEFIKNHWEMLKDDIMNMMCNLHSSGEIDALINKSFITLVPKCDNPITLKDYRPISLIGCLYKILAKVLAIRLQRVIGEVVGECQFAFTRGRQILDCVLIANEVIDSTRKLGNGGVLLKVDFEKAYDSVDWNFLDLVMWKMGFGIKWRCWIKSCVSTASVSILVNGSPTKEFKMLRGLRQGCPMSPFLFNLVAEALNVVLQKAIQLNFFSGLQVSNNGVRISHLQFVDDVIIFCELVDSQVINLKRILRCFQLASGLGINFAKSSVFGLGCTDMEVDRWASLLRCKVEKFPSSYLGIPIGARANSVSVWEPIVQKFERKLSGWKAKQLSMSGRCTLIRSVFLSLPNYFLSIFQIPCTIKEKIDRIQRRFLWGKVNDNRKIHWVAWESICQPKRFGGLDIVDLKLKNRALLNKWVWRYGVEKEALWRKVISDKYGGEVELLLPEVRSFRQFSATWRNIMKPLLTVDDFADTLLLGFGYSLGNGESIRFWHHEWILGVILRFSFPRIYALSVNKEGKVKDFGMLVSGVWEWNVELRRNPFNWERVQWDGLLDMIKEFQVCPLFEDKIIWKANSSGVYSSKSFCEEHCARGQGADQDWSIIWNGLSPPKVELFCWKLLKNRVAVKANLAARNALQGQCLSCALCERVEETVEHFFFSAIFHGASGIRGVLFGVFPGQPIKVDGISLRSG
ncbi:hypothetical protein PTKIN_Ptkin12aG0193100 [Pterospermum kingtungense]